MSVITITSDLGTGYPEAAIFKYKIASVWPDIPVITLTDGIEPLGIKYAAGLVELFFSDFPEDSIHLINVDAEVSPLRNLLVGQFEKHYFITRNNGILPFIGILPEFIYTLETQNTASFSQQCILAIQKIMEKLWTSPPFIKAENIVSYSGKPIEFDNNLLKGTIVYTDHFGNLITNITREKFNEARGKKKFRIILTRHDYIYDISDQYADPNVEDHDLLARFNSKNRLEIALKRENAEKMIGLTTGKLVLIEFYD